MTRPNKTPRPSGSPYLLEAEAAEYLRLAEGTLQNKRIHGDGPPFLKLGGRVVYTVTDLDAWAQSKRRTSTSDCARA